MIGDAEFTFLSAALTALAVWLSLAVCKLLRVVRGTDRFDGWAAASIILALGSAAVLAYGLAAGWTDMAHFQTSMRAGALPGFAITALLAPGVVLGLLILPLKLRDIGALAYPGTIAGTVLLCLGALVVLSLGGRGQMLLLGTAGACLNVAMTLVPERSVTPS